MFYYYSCKQNFIIIFICTFCCIIFQPLIGTRILVGGAGTLVACQNYARIRYVRKILFTFTDFLGKYSYKIVSIFKNISKSITFQCLSEVLLVFYQDSVFQDWLKLCISFHCDCFGILWAENKCFEIFDYSKCVFL